MSVAAFVMTYNRAEILRQTLAALLQQTVVPDLITVIDNGTDIATKKVVEEVGSDSVSYHSMGSNTGPAGAAAYALQTLSARGFDYIYWGDDDDPPKTHDTIERLLHRAELENNSRIAVVAASGAQWDWNSGRLVRIPDTDLHGAVEIDVVAGGSHALLTANAVRAVGFPNPRLFFGFEELEYCLRLRRAGYRLVADGDLMLQYRRLAGRLSWSRQKYAPHFYSSQDLWRRYYSTRNYIYVMRSEFRRPDLARRESGKAALRALASWTKGFQYGRHATALEVRGVIDGYRGRLGLTVQPHEKAITSATARHPESVPAAKPSRPARLSPLVSIVIPTYHRPALVQRAIRSVLQQTRSDFELIVVVDDQSEETAIEAAHTVSDDRVRYISQEHAGVCAARNLGASASVGEWLAFLDDDDEMLPDWIAQMSETASQSRDDVAVICCGAIVKANTRQEVIMPEQLGAAFDSHVGLFLAGTFMVRRELFRDVGGYAHGLVGAENTELSLRLLPYVTRRGMRIVNVAKPLTLIHGGSLARTAQDQRFVRGAQFILEHHYERLRRDPRGCAAFHAVIGVGLARIGKFREARREFFMAARVFPAEWRHWLRALVAFMPPVARRVWKTIG